MATRRMKRGKLTSAMFQAAYLKLKKLAQPATPCPKCGKATIEMKMYPEAAADMAAAGYDGTCCWPGFDEMLK